MRDRRKDSGEVSVRLPSLTLYTDNLPPYVGGCANAFVVRIHPKYRNDSGIHAHEYEHVRQWYVGVLIGILAALTISSIPSAWSVLWPHALIAGCSLHPVAYLLLPRYKLWAEARAYRIQARCYPDDRTRMFSRFIAANYGLAVSVDDAEAAIRG